MAKHEEKPILNFTEAARFLGISPPTLKSYVDEGAIPFRRLKRRYFFSRAALLEWVRGESYASPQK